MDEGGALVDFSACCDPGLLLRSVAGQPVHTFGSTQHFGAGFAKLEASKLLAGRRRPKGPKDAAGGSAEQEAILSVVQNVEGAVCIQIKRLQTVCVQRFHGCGRRRVDACKEVQEEL